MIGWISPFFGSLPQERLHCNHGGFCPPALTKFSFELDGDKLVELYDGETVLSETFFRNGHCFQAYARQHAVWNANFSLSVGLAICEPITETTYVIFATYKVSIDAPISDQNDDVEDCEHSEAEVFKSGCDEGWPAGWGSEDILDRCHTSIQEVVAPYLVDGKLTINYEISKVDEHF